tara:strand:- start:33 stop:767 length:735 start_codon:yes stop_codon:yes gene_type:complete
LRLKGKTVLVTAAGQGIGYSSALSMADEGAIVWATDKNENFLQKFNGVKNIKTALLDVLDKTMIINTFNNMPTIDVLFNCAGYVHSGNILDSSDESLEFAVNINVRSQFWCAKYCIPKMLKQKKGSIINMSSVASSIKGLHSRFIYGTTKAAVIGLTKSIAADFVENSIRCNAICPGTIDTPSLHKRISKFSDPEKAKKNFIKRQPMGRLGNPEEIAYLVVYLASDESAFVTGNVYSIDGGITI